MITKDNKKAMGFFMINIILGLIFLLASIFMVYRVFRSNNDWNSDINQLINRYQRLYEPLEKTSCMQVLNDLVYSNIITQSSGNIFEYKEQTYRIDENPDCKENCLEISNGEKCEFTHIEKKQLENEEEVNEETLIEEEDSSTDEEERILEGEPYYRYSQYYPIIMNKIEKLSKNYDETMDLPLPEFFKDPFLYLAMIWQESGSDKDKERAFIYDPMQVANAWDGANAARSVLIGIKDYPPNCHFEFVDDEFVDKLKETDAYEGSDYSSTNLNAELSIEAGIIWLMYKGTLFNSDCVVVGHDSRFDAIKDYNGGKIKEKYARDVLDKREKLLSALKDEYLYLAKDYLD